MRALVVFESMFGNTQAIAEAVAEGVRSAAEVALVEVGAAPTAIPDFDLLVVGAPTHAFTLSRPASRRDAQDKIDGPVVSRGIGLREWLDALDPGDHALAAAFDTKVRRPRMPGSAARAAAKRLDRSGVAEAAPPTTFYVDGMSGPLVDGELERARRWGAEVAARLARPESPVPG